MSFVDLNVTVTALTDRNAAVASTELIKPDLDLVATATGSSKRENGDVYDLRIGTELAVGRALVNLGRQLIHNANEEVRKASEARTRAEASTAEAKRK